MYPFRILKKEVDAMLIMANYLRIWEMIYHQHEIHKVKCFFLEKINEKKS